MYVSREGEKGTAHFGIPGGITFGIRDTWVNIQWDKGYLRILWNNGKVHGRDLRKCVNK